MFWKSKKLLLSACVTPSKGGFRLLTGIIYSWSDSFTGLPSLWTTDFKLVPQQLVFRLQHELTFYGFLFYFGLNLEYIDIMIVKISSLDYYDV